MATLYCTIEDQEKRFEIDLDETPRVGDYLTRGGATYVVASVTWDVGKRGTSVKLVLRELPPEP
jgi:hypothetical protein